jgi:cytoskeletal protein RodZ
MSVNIGETLRLARVSQGIILEEVERATHVKYKYLVAIEANAFGEIPALAYVRAYVRKYAEFVGLDPEPLLEAIQSTVPATYKLELDTERVPTPPVDAFLKRKNPWLRILWIGIGIIVGLILVLLLINWLVPSVPSTGTPPDSSTETINPSPSETNSTPTGSPEPTESTVASSPASPEIEFRVTAIDGGDLTVIIDGKAQFEGTMEAGQKGTWRGSAFQLTFDDPTKFVLEINGTEIAAPLPLVFAYPPASP